MPPTWSSFPETVTLLMTAKPNTSSVLVPPVRTTFIVAPSVAGAAIGRIEFGVGNAQIGSMIIGAPSSTKPVVLIGSFESSKRLTPPSTREATAT